MSESAEWMAAHQGEFMYTWGFVWTCDDDCGCSEAQVVSYYRNKTDRRFRVPVSEWHGEFYSDYEPGADADLAAYRRQLKADDPDREAAIEWQPGVDYDLVRGS